MKSIRIRLGSVREILFLQRLKYQMMKIISFNVNGVRASVKKGLVNSLRTLNADIVCLQETKATVTQVKEALNEMTEYEIHANEALRPGYSGTAVLTKVKPLNVTYGIDMDEHDGEGRVIAVEYEHFFLVNIYVPNSGNGLVRLDYREQWDALLLTYLKKLEALKPVVFCGDLNVAHRPIDIKNDKANYNKTAGYTQTEIDGMNNYLNSGLVDTFRQLHPDTVKYSWWSYRANARARNIGWRIDYILISESLVPQLKDAFILNDIHGSDHCPVGIEINL